MSENSFRKRKKYTWPLVTAMVVGTIVGSGIVKDSVLWAAEGGLWALGGLLFVWVGFFIVGISMCDNASMMSEKGGVYAWSKNTLGRFWGVQVGWLYIIGYTCLSVILSWLAYMNTLSAITYFLPDQTAFMAASIFSIVLPMFFIGAFTIVFIIGVKPSVQVAVAFFTIKTAMWLTIVGIGLLNFEISNIKIYTDSHPLPAILSVASLSVFAMLGLDSASVVIDDIHEPGKNFTKGFVIGMFIVLILYASTIIMTLGLIGQSGAQLYKDTGITGIFLDVLELPTPVLLLFIVISIIGTLFLTMYLVVRLTGAMAENGDYFFSKHVQKHIKKQNELTGLYKVEMPKRALIINMIVYAIFFILIFIENNYGTYFVLFCVYYLGILAILVILFFICLTNFVAHRMGLAKKRNKEKKEFRWARGIIIPLVGMVASGFILFLSVYFMWTNPAFPLPGPEDTIYWEYWQLLGRIFPALMIIPGILFYSLKTRRKMKSGKLNPTKIQIKVAKEEKSSKKMKKEEKKKKRNKSKENT